MGWVERGRVEADSPGRRDSVSKGMEGALRKAVGEGWRLEREAELACGEPAMPSQCQEPTTCQMTAAEGL